MHACTPVRHSSGLLMVDLTAQLQNSSGESAHTERLRMSEAMMMEGGILIKDPRYNLYTERAFMGLRSMYWGLSSREKQRDARHASGNQMGIMPPKEKPRSLCARLNALGISVDAIPIPPIGYINPFWRYFDPMQEEVGDVGEHNRYRPQAVIPRRFSPIWSSVTMGQGQQILTIAETVMTMLEEAWQLPEGALTEPVKGGHNLISSTGSLVSDPYLGMREFQNTLKLTDAQLEWYALREGALITGAHPDLNWVSVHTRPANGEGSFYILTNSGRVVCIEIPEGWVLVHGGLALERFTAGLVKPLLHWAIVSSQMLALLTGQNNTPVWRGTCNGFVSPRLGYMIEPHAVFQKFSGSRLYESISYGDLVKEVISATGQDSRR